MNEGNDSVKEVGMPAPGTPSNNEHSVGSKFRSDLNHKLRTPLNAIIGFAELLALHPSSKRGTADLQQILKSAREMLRIIERELTDPKEEPVSKAGAIMAVGHACDILYIEDDAVNFTLVERILEFRPGVSVVHASDGAMGLKFAESHQPRLILLDLNLPDMHGAEILAFLQEQPETAGIPVVILSADATPSQIERLLGAGARNYLTKPFDLDQFLTVIDEFIQTPADEAEGDAGTGAANHDAFRGVG
ncbi:MAG: response regulator [Chthoniobacterales bacterium]